MSSQPINVYEAKTHLSQLLERASRGEEIVIAKSGKPIARLMPLPAPIQRTPGAWKGKVKIAEDFDSFTEEDAIDWYGE